MPEDSLIDKVVLITGAGRGVGRAAALAFAAQGARVAANDLTPVNLDQTLAACTATGGQARPYLEDVAKKMAVQALIEAVIDDFGQIDILINNAGVHPRQSILTLDEWDWNRTLEVNLSGPFYLIQSVGRMMIDRGQGGVILNVAAAAGLPDFPFADLPVQSAAYLASKGGLAALSRAAARELGAYNIIVDCTFPAEDADCDAVAAQLVDRCIAATED
ncbi:MAG TPA: SDR family NAD(P)-dependent oxidoreductase [Anaerolineaceae bacterium]|nr:SDR family NAD(P)-dependent oxidoreductase [Anaerolineaceae bacterium]